MGKVVLSEFYVGSSANALHKASLKERDVWFIKKPLTTDDGDCKKSNSRAESCRALDRADVEFCSQGMQSLSH